MVERRQRSPRPALLSRMRERARAPRKKPYHMHHGGMLHKLVCRMSGNMPWPALLDDSGNS
jgi:hypothetical protein